MKIKRILALTDFSETANLALRQALILAEKTKAEITVLHARLLNEDRSVKLPKKLAHLELAEDQIDGEISKYIEECLGDTNAVTVRHEVIRGHSAYSAILSFLNENPVDLVVIGTHGRTNLEQLLLGSVAEKVVRYAPCPVVTIPRGYHLNSSIQTVVVPFDFSEQAHFALQTAVDVTGESAKIELLYVFEKEKKPAFQLQGIFSNFTILPEIRAQAQKKVKEITADLNSPSRTIKLTVSEGVPHKKIAEFVNKKQSDLVIMASQGQVGLDRFLLGSTTERVIRSVYRPILTLKKKNLI